VFAAFNVTNVGEAVVWGAGVVGAIVTVFRLFGVYILAPYARSQEKKDDDRLERAISPLRDELAEVRGELSYNGGASTKDAVRRIDRRLTRLEGWLHTGDDIAKDDLLP
jgi:hypothetical protein